MESNNSFKTTIAKIHFEPTLSLGHIASAIIFLLGGLGAWYSLKEDVSNYKAESKIRWELQDKTMQDIQLKNKEQDLALRELGVELKSELRSNSAEIKQEFRDLRTEMRAQQNVKRTP